MLRPRWLLVLLSTCVIMFYTFSCGDDDTPENTDLNEKPPVGDGTGLVKGVKDGIGTDAIDASDQSTTDKNLNKDPELQETFEDPVDTPEKEPGEGSGEGSGGESSAGGPGEGSGGEGSGGEGSGGEGSGGEGSGGEPDVPDEVPTPDKFEDLLNFKDYCLIAYDRQYAENYIPAFPSPDHFESWLLDIQHTVQMIRLRIPAPVKPGDIDADCQKAYALLQQIEVLDLSPMSSGAELGIVNISPISGALKLKRLNLSYNQVTNIKFLRNLVTLEDLELKGNMILEIPDMYNSKTGKFLKSIQTIGLNYQDRLDPGKEINFHFNAIYYSRRSLRMIEIDRNKVKPNVFLNLDRDFKVSNPEVIMFVKGDYYCRDIVKYPTQIEEQRAKRCD